MNDLIFNFEANNEQNVVLLKLKKNSSKQKFNEFFSIFVVRLSVIMNQISFDDDVKINYLRKLMNFRFRKLFMNVIDIRNYRQYVNKNVQIIHNMFEIDQKYEQQKLIFKFKFKTFTRNIDRKKKRIHSKIKIKKNANFLEKSLTLKMKKSFV